MSSVFLRFLYLLFMCLRFDTNSVSLYIYMSNDKIFILKLMPPWVWLLSLCTVVVYLTCHLMSSKACCALCLGYITNFIYLFVCNEVCLLSICLCVLFLQSFWGVINQLDYSDSLQQLHRWWLMFRWAKVVELDWWKLRDEGPPVDCFDSVTYIVVLVDHWNISRCRDVPTK